MPGIEFDYAIRYSVFNFRLPVLPPKLNAFPGVSDIIRAN